MIKWTGFESFIRSNSVWTPTTTGIVVRFPSCSLKLGTFFYALVLGKWKYLSTPHRFMQLMTLIRNQFNIFLCDLAMKPHLKIKYFQNQSLQWRFSNKSPVLLEKKIKQIQPIFDTEKWLWKSEFWDFWGVRQWHD